MNFYSFNRRTDMYLKSLNRASNLARAIAKRESVPQLGKSFMDLYFNNVIAIFNYTLKFC